MGDEHGMARCRQRLGDRAADEPGPAEDYDPHRCLRWRARPGPGSVWLMRPRLGAARPGGYGFLPRAALSRSALPQRSAIKCPGPGLSRAGRLLGEVAGEPGDDGRGGVLRCPVAGVEAVGDVAAEPAAELNLLFDIAASPGRTRVDAGAPQ